MFLSSQTKIVYIQCIQYIMYINNPESCPWGTVILGWTLSVSALTLRRGLVGRHDKSLKSDAKLNLSLHLRRHLQILEYANKRRFGGETAKLILIVLAVWFHLKNQLKLHLNKFLIEKKNEMKSLTGTWPTYETRQNWSF